jgi:hypothetical protein
MPPGVLPGVVRVAASGPVGRTARDRSAPGLTPIATELASTAGGQDPSAAVQAPRPSGLPPSAGGQDPSAGGQDQARLVGPLREVPRGDRAGCPRPTDAEVGASPGGGGPGRHAAVLDRTQEEFLRLDEVSAAAGLGELRASFAAGRGPAGLGRSRVAVGLASSALVLAGLVIHAARDAPALLLLLAGPALIGGAAWRVWRRRHADGRAWVQIRRGGLAYRQAIRGPVTVGWDHVDDVLCRLIATRAVRGGRAGRACAVSSLTVTARPIRLELSAPGDRLAAFGELARRAAVPTTLAELERQIRRGGQARYQPANCRFRRSRWSPGRARTLPTTTTRARTMPGRALGRALGRGRATAWVVDARGLSGPDGSVRWHEVSRVEVRRARVDVHVRGESRIRLAVPLIGGSSRSAAFAALIGRLASRPAGDERAGPDPAPPAGRQPAGRQPAGRQPAGREPAGREPAGREPAGREPAG